MCLGIPGKVLCWLEREGAFAQAEVEFDGVRRVVHMACVTEAEVGDFVVVHAGIAISKIDPLEAKRIFETLAEWNEDEGWHPDTPEESEASS